MQTQLTDAALAALTVDTGDPELALTLYGDAVIELTLKPMPSAVPVAVRLRAMLKRCRRDWDLRCTAITAKPAPIAPTCPIGGDDA